jgi:2-C-methyl-D-erythritol 4-phosphate cytidylyltransferase / 2-C-methyl-D-erythritol 2,4-cyclodiphosphate synthase
LPVAAAADQHYDTNMSTIAVIIVAAGRGERAGGPLPKQWQRLGSARVIDHTLAAFGGIGDIVTVIHPDDAHRAANLPGAVVFGGATRALSVRAGLEALAATAPDLVLIHDAARATCPPEVIRAVIAALADHPAAAPGLAVSDALWRAEDAEVRAITPRAGLYRAQTPQGFRFAAIYAAHQGDLAGNAADDVELALAAGIPVKIVPGHEDNLKITTSADFARATRLVEKRDMRIGSGFDVHAFGPGDHVTLAGVKIPFSQGVEAHSDGDVVLHALADALYGALADGDIGHHFPPSEATWKGMDSRVFLAHAAAKAALAGFRIANLDVTILAEAPKVAPHAAAMRQNVALTMGIQADQVSIKATTTERLGFVGRGEGLAASATVLLVAA